MTNMKEKINSDQNQEPIFVDTNDLDIDRGKKDYSKVYELPSIKARYISTLIDIMLIMLAIFGIVELLDKFENVPDYIRYVLIAVVILYEPILTTISCTLGQLLMDIRVRKFKDPEKKVLFHEAIIRLLPKLILGWISFLLIIFSVNKRAIHDYVSGTIVIIPKRKIEKPAVNPSL
jgi:uncharacterized RDD family membrane protein YckC